MITTRSKCGLGHMLEDDNSGKHGHVVERERERERESKAIHTGPTDGRPLFPPL